MLEPLWVLLDRLLWSGRAQAADPLAGLLRLLRYPFAVLRDLSGAITEGPGYNVFAHVNGRWLTPGHGTLAGITRRSLIELAREAGQRVDEGCLTADDLLRADEVLVTSTAGGIMPVTAVNGTPVGAGVPGPLTRDLKDRYWARHQDPRYSTPVRYDDPA